MLCKSLVSLAKKECESIMTSDKKKNQVTKLVSIINEAEAAISINYEGLKVFQVEELRDNLREVDGQFNVIKNTLFRIATSNSKRDELNELIDGPTAIITTKKDVVAPTKVLFDFLKANEGALKINKGFYFGNIVDATYIKEISKIPAKETLLAKFCAQLVMPLMKFMNLSTSTTSKFQLLLKSRIEQVANNPETAVADKAVADKAVADKDDASV